MVLRIFYVYGLIDPATSEVRYVGKTHRVLRDRYDEHVRGACPATRQWVRSLGEPPGLVILHTAPEGQMRVKGHSVPISVSTFAETKWIKRFSRTVINARKRDSSPHTWDWLVNPDEEQT
jgi:hypothetical protein